MRDVYFTEGFAVSINVLVEQLFAEAQNCKVPMPPATADCHLPFSLPPATCFLTFTFSYCRCLLPSATANCLLFKSTGAIHTIPALGHQ